MLTHWFRKGKAPLWFKIGIVLIFFVVYSLFLFYVLFPPIGAVLNDNTVEDSAPSMSENFDG